MPDLARPRFVAGVVDLDAALEIVGALAGGAAEQLVINQHDVAMRPHLVRMRVPRQRDLREDARLSRIRDIYDRGALGRAHMPDTGKIPLGDDLPAAGNIEPGEVAQ